MSNELTQLRECYETLGMSVEEIAEDRSLDVVAVKAGLMQCSPRYRQSCRLETEEEDPTLNFSNNDLREVNDVIRQIALGSEDDNLRLKAAMYIRDDKKGRKEVIKAVSNMNLNILQFNETMSQLRETKNRLLGKDIVNV